MKKCILLSCLFLSFSTYANLQEIFGHSYTGDKCGSDFECESLCCNQEGTCAEHDPSSRPAKFCSKPAGAECMTSDFCETYEMMRCRIYKVGTRSDGSITCTLRCPIVVVKGNCINSICSAPKSFPVPNFDPNDCSQAVDL